MKTNSLRLAITLIICLLAFKSWSSHLLGAEISYTCIAPGTYIANFKGYYDCSISAGPAQSLQFQLASPGCSTTQIFSATLVGNPKLMLPYCAAFGNACSPLAPYTILEATYAANFTLPGQCSGYILSIQDCTIRPMINLGGASNPANSCAYLEAYINPVISNVPVNSPEFYNIPTLYFTLNSPATIPNVALNSSISGLDSVSYALKPALESAGTPLLYAAGTSFSNPIPSATPLNLNPVSGLLSFTPNVFNPGPGFSQNIYAVIVEIMGFKKLNGQMSKVTSAQRRIPVIIVNWTPNQNPVIQNLTVNGQSLPPSGIMEVVSGNTTTVQFSTADSNSADTVTIQNPDPANLVLTTSGNKFPIGNLTMNLSTEGMYWFPVIVKDNSCPVRGVTTQMVGIKVVAKPLSGNREISTANSFSAFPNPFTSQIFFKINSQSKAKIILIFNLLGQQIDEIELQSSAVGEEQVRWKNAANFPKGTYLARLISEGKAVHTLKFVKH